MYYILAILNMYYETQGLIYILWRMLIFLFLAGIQPREFRLQVLANPPVVYGFNVTSIFKVFVVLF